MGFERRLIEKYMEQHQRCPVSGDELAAEDLLPVQCNRAAKPRPASATSIPGLLQLFQSEWDALMLETYTLKQHMDAVRQELSHSLYQHDAACRVIARLIKERDSARSQLSNVQTKVQQVQEELREEPQEMEEDGKLSKAIIKKMQDMSEKLTAKRKKRTISEGCAKPDDIGKFDQIDTQTPHSAANPGVLTVAIHADQKHVFTGGMDAVVLMYDREGQQIVHTMKGHSKAVRRVLHHPTRHDLLLSCSDDTTVRVWSMAEEGKCLHVMADHTGPVKGITLNATGEYVVTASEDNTWNFSDIETGKMLVKVRDEGDNPVKSGFSCARFHPDGLILGTGTNDHSTCIWDVKGCANVATFVGHKGPVTSLSFSENGFYLATSSADGQVKLWDLRRLTNFRTLSFEDNAPVQCTVFDYSGNYLAIGSSNIKLYSTKQWSEIKVFPQHTAAVTDVQWGNDATWLVSTSKDRHVSFYGA
eukprot:NODE_52_length_1556_cov_267.960223_g49_i0.p1 GENE.NODE_52_length_1556_cov_267.960223_g49_i0~~NODE_52_length_1556_cov_267.960223_g49_i0.p1  ORF type:complete len:474 (-),score=65.91 NODE_52_length_1556_cov_267.960223_g49_i0:75-1496(-)